MRFWLPLTLGFIGSVLGTLMLRAIALVEHESEHDSNKLIYLAISLEFVAGLMGIATWQLWSRYGNDKRVLLCELVGSVIGTYLALKFGL